MYAILDIETTGGKYNEEGITEIAIYKFDGHEIVDQFISLINPEKPIQPFVVKLTGINNEMLKNAPKFYEVAKRIVEITEDCIIVAHNAGFDYRILKTEFDRLGYPYERKSLCTVELAEKLLPEQKSYSLGKLVRSLGIPMSERHRASGDALATVQLFKLLLAKDIKKEIISETVKVNSKKQVEDRLLRLIDPIPSQTGVYYFHREDGKIIYIGKSRNIRKKITQHFTNQNNKSVRIQEEVHYINYELTGNDLIAQLKEYIEVKKNKPKFNRHTRKPVFEYGLEEVVNDKGYIRLVVSRIKRNQKFITSFSNIQQAKSWMSRWAEKYGLCIDLVDSKLPIPTCHHTPEIHCNGTCFLKEPAEVYNNRAKDLINEQSLYNKNQMIIDKGRTSGEQSIVLLEGGELKGFGFFTLNHQIQNKEIFKSILTPLKHNADAKHIIQNYLRQQKNIKVVDL